MVNKAKAAAKPAVTDADPANGAATETKAGATEAGQSTTAPDQPRADIKTAATEQPAPPLVEPVAAKVKTPPPPSKLFVIVKGPVKGRWRAGRHFTPEAVSIPMEDLSDDEKAALIADPELSVTTSEA